MRRAQSASDSDPGAPGRAGEAACHRDCGQCQWDSDTETQRVRAAPSRSRSELEATASHWAEGPRDGRSDSESSDGVSDRGGRRASSTSMPEWGSVSGSPDRRSRGRARTHSLLHPQSIVRSCQCGRPGPGELGDHHSSLRLGLPVRRRRPRPGSRCQWQRTGTRASATVPACVRREAPGSMARMGAWLGACRRPGSRRESTMIRPIIIMIMISGSWLRRRRDWRRLMKRPGKHYPFYRKTVAETQPGVSVRKWNGIRVGNGLKRAGPPSVGRRFVKSRTTDLRRWEEPLRSFVSINTHPRPLKRV
jgi:hypothetical protein